MARNSAKGVSGLPIYILLHPNRFNLVFRYDLAWKTGTLYSR